MITIKDISRISGLSKTTISKVLNDYPDVSKETREKVLRICKEQGFIPSSLGRNLSTKRTFTIGVVFSEETEQGITHPFFAEFLNEFKNEIERNGYDVLLIGNKVGDYVHSYLSHCKQKSVDGVVILSAYEYEEGIIELVNSDIPKVIMESQFENQCCFFSNNYQAITNIIKYLVSQGHKDIGFISGDLTTIAGSERYRAFKSEMNNQKLKIVDEWVFEGPHYTIEEGKNACQRMIKLDKWPTALVCSSDTLAIGCMLELLSNGYSVPDDLSITGFDNIAISKLFTPAITTVNQNKKLLAQKAMESLLAQINGKFFERKTSILPCEIIYRGSVKKLN